MGKWQPDKSLTVPMYRQLAEHIVEMIRSGKLDAASRLSVRKYAEKYKVSTMTVIEAFELLKEGGVLESLPRSGTKISGNALENILTNTQNWQQLTKVGRQINNEKYWIKSSRRTQSANNIKLSGINIHQKSFHPDAPIRQAMNSLLLSDEIKEYGFQYSIHGLPHLREAVLGHLEQYGINTNINNIMIFNSNTDAKFAIFNAILRPGMNFFVMQYDMISKMGVVPTFGAHLQSIGIVDGRPDFKTFRSQIKHKGNGLLYITCAEHIPTGITLTGDEQSELMDICNELSLPIIEADSYRDIWLKKPPPPLKAQDSNDRVIYIGNFSHMAYTGLRLSWAVMPDALINKIYDVKSQIFGTNTTILELLGYEMLTRGYYAEFMKKLRKSLPGRLSSIKSVLHEYFDGIAAWDDKNIINHAWLKFSHGIDMSKIFDSCPNITFTPGKAFGADNSYAYFSPLISSIHDMETGLRTISEAIKSYLR